MDPIAGGPRRMSHCRDNCMIYADLLSVFLSDVEVQLHSRCGECGSYPKNDMSVQPADV